MTQGSDSVFERKLRRADVLKLGAAVGGATLLAACGTEETAETQPAQQQAEHPPIEEESGQLEAFEWAGNEYPTFGGQGGPLQGYVDKYGVPKYTFLTSDDQALAKVLAGGYRPDIIHPCANYTPGWTEADLIQPWDPSLLTNFNDLAPEVLKIGVVDGQQYFMPIDGGPSSPMYRGDKIELENGTESWNILYDERYKGKISWWDTPIENFVIWGQMNDVADPWNMSQDEIDAGKEFLISKKHLCRNFWSSQTDLDADIAAGNIWAAYAWAGSYVNAKKAGLDVVYSQPVEGRINSFCGMVLAKDTAMYRHAHAYLDALLSPETALWLETNYAYLHPNTKVDVSKMDPDLVEAFQLDDPAALQESGTFIQPMATDVRQRYGAAWSDVKAA
jgi:spermidine/putrescine transport system substrate-binding protein